MTTIEDVNRRKSDDEKRREQEEWEKIRNEILQHNASLAPILCSCGRGNVSTIIGCNDCWNEHSSTFTEELEDPNFIMNRRKHRGN